MNEYAVLLYFNDKTSKALTRLINVAADACGNRYMFEPSPIPPHITVCYFSADSLDDALRLVDEKAGTLVAGGVVWPALGAFPKTVIYAAPVANDYLLSMCAGFNALLDGTIKLADYYRPNNWMPHTSLATKLTPDQFDRALIAVANNFVPTAGTATSLALAACERFDELKRLELKIS